jgi:hypothetical protein
MTRSLASSGFSVRVNSKQKSRFGDSAGTETSTLRGVPRRNLPVPRLAGLDFKAAAQSSFSDRLA